jgi:hypothetical protein
VCVGTVLYGHNTQKGGRCELGGRRALEKLPVVNNRCAMLAGQLKAVGRQENGRGLGKRRGVFLAVSQPTMVDLVESDWATPIFLVRLDLTFLVTCILPCHTKSYPPPFSK